MKKLQFIHSITENRDFGKVTVNQKMVIEVNYDFRTHDIETLSVNIYENGKFMAEISGLLDTCQGNPLNKVIDAIDWRELFDRDIDQEIDYYKANSDSAGIADNFFEMMGNIGLDHTKKGLGTETIKS